MAISKMLCLLGTQDIPVIQDQPKFVVDLLESNIILYGSSMSGKTNFIKLLVTILHKQYRESQEQIFILDFGGALAEFESLPLVAAYFDNANEEYVKRVFNLLEDQLKENVKQLKGKNYRDVSDNQPIHTTLLIDNVNAFLDEPRYSAYQEKLAKLCRDGLSKGITVIMTAGSTKGTTSLMSSFKQKIALELPQESYLEVFNHKVIPVGNNPGHGFANVTVNTADNAATYPMQMAYELQLNVSDDINDPCFQENLAKYFQGRTVKKYKRFPEILTVDSYYEFAGEQPCQTSSEVSVGLDYTECKPILVDFTSTKCVAIYGKKGFGKTNLLKVLLKGFINNSLYNFVFFDDGREQLKWCSDQVSHIRKEYIAGHEEKKLYYKEKTASTVSRDQTLKEVPTKLSPMQLFVKLIHEQYMDLSQVRRMSNPVLAEIFGTGIVLPSQAATTDKRNTVFVLQSKFLYVNSTASKDFMEVILPSLVARADEMNWIFIFTDVKSISDSETRDNFHTTIGNAFLLDSIAEFVGERGSKSIFGSMDVKSLKVSVSVDENGDYIYQIDDVTSTGNANYILAMQEDSKPTPSSPTAATLSSVSIDKAGASYLEQHDFGIVANGAVKIALTAELSHNMPVKFILSDGQEVTDDSPRFYSHENIYRASGEFIVKLEENESFKDVSLSVTIENGDQSSTVDLPLNLNGNNSTSRLIIDNKLPSVSSLTLKNHGLEGEHYFDAKGVFVDNESGIRSIRYRWDNDVKSTNWTNYDNFSHNPGDKVDFYVKTDWNNSTDPRSVRPDGSHKLELEITDNAGNVYRDGGNLITDGADTKAPQPTYIRLDKTTETTWDKIINILSFGTFVNQKLILSLKVEDRTETEQSSGVKSVALTDGTGDTEKIIAADIKSTDGIYTYSMEPDQIISSWYLKLTDYNGNTEYFLIRDLLNSDIAKEPVEETTASEDDEAETTTTTTGMDWSQLTNDKSGMWIFDKTSPVVTPDYSEGIYEDGVYYYSDGTFTLNCTDNAALQSIIIKKSYRLTDADDWSDLEPYSKKFNKITTEDAFTFSTKSLKNGWYRFEVSILDGAQNKNTPSLSVFEIYVDHAKPEGMVSVISPSAPNYKFQDDDSTYWVRERDADEKYLPITFRIDATPKGSKLRAIKVEVFGGNGKTKTFDFNKKDIIEEDGKYYVTALISTDPSSKDYLQLSENNTYEVKATVEAASHNKSDEINFILHVDTENPVVESFSVERKNTAAETILNVLTFGAFANDSLKLTVKVKDGQNDIGLDHVDISYTDTNGQSVCTTLTEESTGVYTCELALDTKVFQSDIVVTAYDKLNKSSKNAPNIQNTTGDKHTKDGNTFVMLEAEAPTLKIILPSSDSSKRDDGQIWYRQHSDATEGDAIKYIEVVVKDDASGIQRINMLINGQPIDHFVDEASQNAVITDIERDKTKILDFDSTRAMGELDRASLCNEFHYFYSTESIADKIQANADGSYVITFEITDNAGNVTTAPVDENGTLYTDEKVIYYRDVVVPSVTQFIFDPASFDNISEVNQEDFIQKLEYGYYFKTAFDVMLTSVDPEPPSGLDYAVFRMVPYENGELKPEIISDPVPFVNGVAKYSIPKGFKGQIYGKAYDKVSNVSEERTPQGFVIDETAPTITIQELPENPAGKDANGNNIYTNSISIRVTISDTQSGLRTISYSKDSELDKFDDVITGIPNDAGTSDKKTLDNGWEITGNDVNLVTEVSKVFTFDKDDNDIKMTFKATDRSGNECEPKSSGIFTIDTIAPQIAISNSSNLLNGQYYNGSTEYTITVTERNFSQDLIIANIKNDFTNTVPNVSFTSNGNSNHTAKVSFPEGDYSFSLSGTDLGGHKAVITYNGADVNDYFFTSFNVDATNPKIQTNFKSFGADDNEAVYYNKLQTAEIIVTEHNFTDGDMGISVKRKDPGTSHIVGGDGWSEIGYTSNWKTDGDKHTLTIKFEKDGVYRITMTPKDRAGNAGEFAEGSSDHSTVFEVDTVIPTYEKRDSTSSSEKNFVATPFCDVYDEKRKNDPPPTVLFDDVNFDRIEVDTIIYTPTYENGKELGEIIMSPVSEELSKPITDKQFTLSDFNKDGVYALTFVAVDKAGNKSDPISNTYFRMVDTDVLVYIYNSKIGDKNSDDDSKKPTGYYSLMNTDGKAISKKATDFDNLDILVIKPKSDKQAGTLVLREDEKQYSPYDYNAFSIEEESVSETATMLKMHLPGEYFSETFRDDGLNTRMYLSVSIRDDVYLDLASIHIDNEAPTATIPDDFKNWHNYFFESEQTITLTDISELLDDTKTKVYECPRNGERKEIPHTYDPESNTLSFTLTKGVHHIDITLVDEAGNEYNIDRVKYVRVGNFRLYLGGGIVIALGALAAFFIIRRKRRT